MLPRPVLIISGLNDQLGFLDAQEERERQRADGQAHADQRSDIRISRARVEADPRAEGKPGQDHGPSGKSSTKKIERRANVVALASAAVVIAGALADAAKIEAQRGHPQTERCLGDAEDDFVMHRPAVERVRVADDDARARR